jgi:hypothetical protein
MEFFLFIITFNSISIFRSVADGRWTRLQLHNSASDGVEHPVLFVFSGWNWPSNNKILTFLESASNLQSEKVPYRYIGATSIFWPSYKNFQSSRPRGSRQTKKKAFQGSGEINFYKIVKKPTLIYKPFEWNLEGVF